MIKHRLDPIEVNQLAAQTLGAKLDLVQAPESGLAAGNIVPIPLGPGGLLLHGCMHGVRAISAQIDSHPGLNIEIRLRGHSQTHNATDPACQFVLEEGKVLVRGGAHSQSWRVTLPAQPRFTTVSFLLSIDTIQALHALAPTLSKQLLDWVEQDYLHILPATPLICSLAEHALALSPYQPHVTLKGYGLLLELLPEIQAVFAQQIITPVSDSDHNLVAQARLLISHNPSIAFSADTLAERCFVSKSRLKTAFRHASNTPLTTTIRLTALNQAKRLLLSGHKVSQVAGTVGYQTPEAFSKAFKQAFGLSPRA